MNIAHLLPYSAQFPLVKHNGRYEWVLRLAQAQARTGNTVSIYCAPGSSDPSSQIAWRTAPHDFRDKSLNNISLIQTALQNSHDIYHSHFDYIHYFLADTTNKPFIYTQHWFPNQNFAHAAEYNKTQNVLAIPVTQLMHAENKKLGLPTSDTIYHGIDLDQFQLNTAPRQNRLIFIGRIAPHKGVHLAVQAALDAGAQLDIVGKIQPQDEAYWQTILPHVDGQQIRYLGPRPHSDIPALFAQAKALIFPSQASESFGLVTVEAQACGTPVIISDIGASSELVVHGKTGYICKTPDDYQAAIGKVHTLSPADCRTNAERFSLDAMVKSYENLYTKLASQPAPSPGQL